MIPPAPPGAGPSGPGPAFHTGYSMASRSTTEMEYDGTSTIGESVGTSIAVENGYSDHVDRRRVISEDDFHSETFSDDTENYVSKANTDDYEMGSDNGGNISDDSETYVGKGNAKAAINDDLRQLSIQTNPEDPEAEVEADDDDDVGAFDDDDEEAFEDDMDAFDDEEEAFDFGDEDGESDDETVTV